MMCPFTVAPGAGSAGGADAVRAAAYGSVAVRRPAAPQVDAPRPCDRAIFIGDRPRSTSLMSWPPPSPILLSSAPPPPSESQIWSVLILECAAEAGTTRSCWALAALGTWRTPRRYVAASTAPARLCEVLSQAGR